MVLTGDRKKRFIECESLSPCRTENTYAGYQNVKDHEEEEGGHVFERGHHEGVRFFEQFFFYLFWQASLSAWLGFESPLIKIHPQRVALGLTYDIVEPLANGTWRLYCVVKTATVGTSSRVAPAPTRARSGHVQHGQLWHHKNMACTFHSKLYCTEPKIAIEPFPSIRQFPAVSPKPRGSGERGE